MSAARSRVCSPVAPPLITAEVLLRADLSCRRWMAVIVGKRRESVSKRLARKIERARKPLVNPFTRQKEDWNDERYREVAANIALTLHPDQSTLRKAFEAFELDPQNPFHWRRLLQFLADIHFGGPRSGAPAKWNEECWRQFETHVAFARERLAQSGEKSPSHERIANFLKERFKPLYNLISAGTIRRYMTVPPPAIRKSRGKRFDTE
jgi:hypothetical protein